MPITIPADVRRFMVMHKYNGDKKKIAIIKMLMHHRHFDMQPFFEWDLKVLPLTISWFGRARSIGTGIGNAAIDKQKLGAIYQFIRAMPEVFEPAPAVGEKRKRGVDGQKVSM